jgi:Tol biopolymer transport system component
MSLKPGQRLGPYQIEASLGAGGMGEVYRARDTRLDRSVAVKVLPSHLAENAQRRERFEREARAVSALSHPHICALFDVGEEDGVSFLVMEHLDGESLADRLAKGALPLKELLKLGAQVADALARAHREGIVHRDLKPGNVMLTKSGAKLLDFGLAKNVVADHEPTESSAPTEAAPGAMPLDSDAATGAKPPLTEAGAILGTFQYMAPEQLEGEEADGRADIWALGCLLYEMATGKAPFIGKSQASLISSIMRDAPVPIADRQPLTPSSLDHVISRCLEKDRDDRWQSAHDVAEELSWIQSSGGTKPAAAPGAADTPARPGPRWWAVALAALAAVMAGVLLDRALVGGSPGTAREAAPVTQQLTFQKGVERHPALSPDGKLLAWVSDDAGNDDVYIQRVDGRNALNLTANSPDADNEPSFSPDGSQIAFHSDRDGGGIFVMGATGESVRRVSDLGHNPAWSPDGRQLAVSTEEIVDPMARQGTAELWIIDVATGETKRLYAGDAVQPAWSPDGRRIAFWRVDGNSGQRDLATIDAGGQSDPAPVTNDAAVDWSPVWSPDGASLFFVSDRGGTMNVWRVSVDPGTGRSPADPVLVGAPAEDVAGLSAASAGGQFAYTSRSALHELHLLTLDPGHPGLGGEGRVLYSGSLPIRDPHPSPGGDQIALTTRGSQEDLYILDPESGELRQLTNDLARDRGPQWSPDGTRIAFYSNRSGTYQVWLIRADGSGLRQLTDVADGAWYPVWSPDGTRLAFPTGKATCIATVGDTPASTAECLPEVSGDRWFEVRDWSADGHWLVGNQSLRAGAMVPEVLLWSLEDEEYRPVETRGLVSRWLPDSRTLLLLDERPGLVTVDRESGAVRFVSPLEVDGAIDQKSLGLSRDGRTVVVQSDIFESNVWLLALPELSANPL